MIRQTGGRAVGATSTRSRPASRAMRKASAVEVGPTFSSCALIRKIGEILICSLWRKFVGMAATPKNLARIVGHAPGGERLDLQLKHTKFTSTSSGISLPCERRILQRAVYIGPSRRFN